MPLIDVEKCADRSGDRPRAPVRELTDGFVRACRGKPEVGQIGITDVEKSNRGADGVLNNDR